MIEIIALYKKRYKKTNFPTSAHCITIKSHYVVTFSYQLSLAVRKKRKHHQSLRFFLRILEDNLGPVPELVSGGFVIEQALVVKPLLKIASLQGTGLTVG